MGNGERGMGAWERVYRSNPPENSKWWTKEKKRVWQLVLSKHSLNTIIGANSMDGKCRFYWMILPWNVDLVAHKLGFCLAYNRSQIFGELSSILSKVAQHFNNEFRHTSLRPLFSIFTRLIILQGNEVYFQLQPNNVVKQTMEWLSHQIFDDITDVSQVFSFANICDSYLGRVPWSTEFHVRLQVM